MAAGSRSTWLAGVLAVAAVGCSKDRSSPPDPPATTAPQAADCGHAACGPNFFVDATQAGDCAQGANCAITLSLVATGAFHINDEYPYKFRADDAAGFTFLGTDAAGPNVFSKAASNWQKTGAQTGAMTVGFQSVRKGKASVSGTFKLSVCSAQNCQLEQQTVTVPVAIR